MFGWTPPHSLPVSCVLVGDVVHDQPILRITVVVAYSVENNALGEKSGKLYWFRKEVYFTTTHTLRNIQCCCKINNFVFVEFLKIITKIE